MPISLQALEETRFTWSNPRRVSFQFNQEPSSIFALIYDVFIFLK